MIDREVLLESMLKGYENSYDVERIAEVKEDMPLVARAHFHVTESQCVVFKEFSMWTAESDEYVFIYHVDRLTKEIAEKIIKHTYDVGYPLINLEHMNMKRQHMCTRLVTIVMADQVDDEGVGVIRRCRIYKNFNFSLKGWMEMHTVSVDLSNGAVKGNRYSRETVRFIKELVSVVCQRSKKLNFA